MDADFDSKPAGVPVAAQIVQLVSVIRPFPDQAVLRRRAYFHALDLTKGKPTRTLATDRKV
jgi:hypothetical protein